MENQGSQMFGTGDIPESATSKYMLPMNIISVDRTSKISIFVTREKIRLYCTSSLCSVFQAYKNLLSHISENY